MANPTTVMDWGSGELKFNPDGSLDIYFSMNRRARIRSRLAACGCGVVQRGDADVLAQGDGFQWDVESAADQE